MKLVNLLILIIVLVTLKMNLTNAIPSENRLFRSEPALVGSEETSKIYRRLNCGLETFKVLMLLCPNDSERKYNKQKKEEWNSEDSLMDLRPLKSEDLLAGNDVELDAKKEMELNLAAERISDVHVHNNSKYRRIRRSIIRDCCHKACSIRELEKYC